MRVVHLRVMGAPIEMLDLKVVYSNGQPDDIQVRRILRRGERTNALDLRGGERGRTPDYRHGGYRDPDRGQAGLHFVVHAAPFEVVMQLGRTSFDPDDREVPDRSMCWECSQAGASPDSGNSTPIEPGRVERWRQTHDRRGNWIGPVEDE